MQLEARHLTLVLVTAELGSLRLAAPALGKSQPALDAQLRRIEKALGVTLFHREKDQVRLTALGRQFADGAQHVVSRFEALLARAERYGHENRV